LKDLLKLIYKRLENLENKRFFPSPDFEHSVRINVNGEINAVALIVARAAENADTTSKSAIAEAVACKSAVAETMKITASQKENARKYTACRDDAPQAVITTVTCLATPERIRSYFDVSSLGQYSNISVSSCVATTRIQNTRYPTTPFNGRDNRLLTMIILM